MTNKGTNNDGDNSGIGYIPGKKYWDDKMVKREVSFLGWFTEGFLKEVAHELGLHNH